MFLLVVMILAPARASLRSVLYVETEDMPEIKDGRITYRMSIVFDEVPSQFWNYYDSRTNEIVIDFYGVTLRSPQISMTGSSIFKSFLVSNLATSMSLTGEQAQIRIGADPGWNIESTCQGSKQIRIKVSREIKRVVEEKPFSWQIPVLIAAPVLAGVCAFFVIRAVQGDE